MCSHDCCNDIEISSSHPSQGQGSSQKKRQKGFKISIVNSTFPAPQGDCIMDNTYASSRQTRSQRGEKRCPKVLAIIGRALHLIVIGRESWFSLRVWTMLQWKATQGGRKWTQSSVDWEEKMELGETGGESEPDQNTLYTHSSLEWQNKVEVCLITCICLIFEMIFATHTIVYIHK